MENISIQDNILSVNLNNYTATITVEGSRTTVVLEHNESIPLTRTDNFRDRLLALAKNKSVEL